MKLNMKREHYNRLARRILNFAEFYAVEIAAHRERLELDPRVRDLDKRMRWDLLWAAAEPGFVVDELYPYLNDDHIDSALRRIYPGVQGLLEASGPPQ